MALNMTEDKDRNTDFPPVFVLSEVWNYKFYIINCLLNPSKFHDVTGPRKGSLQIHFNCYQPLQMLYYYSYTVSLQVFQTSIHTSLWLIKSWAKHELYLTIALFKGNLSWNFSIIGIKNNLQTFLHLLIWSPKHSNLSIKTFTAVGKCICFRGRWALVTQNFWSEYGVSRLSNVGLRINMFISCLKRSSQASHKKGTIRLSVWIGLKNSFNMCATSLKIYQFSYH